MSEQVAEVATKSKGMLTNKIGPLPVYAYALIIVGIAWGLHIYRQRQNGQQVPEDSTDVVYDDGSTSPTSPVTGSPFPPAGSYDGVQGGTNGLPAASSNAIWARNATNQLIAEGTDPTLASNAIAKYLGGTALTAAEKAVVSLAVTKFGIPPEGVIPVKAVATPVPAPKPVAKPAPKPVAKPAPKPAPPKVVTKKPAQLYTVRSGDSLSLIAQRYYGNVALWTKLYAANRAKVGSNPNLIHPGLVLVIPA